MDSFNPIIIQMALEKLKGSLKKSKDKNLGKELHMMGVSSGNLKEI